VTRRSLLIALLVVAGLALLTARLSADGPPAGAVHSTGAAAIQGDADCSGSVNPIDSLAILRHDGGIANAPCTRTVTAR